MTRGKPARAPSRRKPRAVGRPPNSAGHDTAARRLDCALTVFAEKGHAAATTDDIIPAAGVAKPSLYHHHESKEALFRTLVGGIYEASERAWDEAVALEKTCAAKLRGMIRVAFAGSARDPRMPRVMFQTHYGPPIAELRQFMADHTARRFAQVVRVMQDGLARGELRGGEAEEDFAGVVHVHVVVHHHDLFGEHHLAHAPNPKSNAQGKSTPANAALSELSPNPSKLWKGH